VPDLKRNQRFMTAEELMERWQISALDLIAVLSEYKLRFRDANDLSTYAYDDAMLKTKFIDMMAFDLVDVERYERDHPEFEPEKSIAKDRRKLGQLEREKNEWNRSLEAAVQIGIYVKEIGKRLKRDVIKDKIRQLSSGELHETTIEKILKAIPLEYRRKKGRPPEEDDQGKI
jgi:hypothetical protein